MVAKVAAVSLSDVDVVCDRLGVWYKKFHLKVLLF